MSDDRLAARLNKYQFQVATEDAGTHKETTVVALDASTGATAGVIAVKHQWESGRNYEQQQMERYGINHGETLADPDEKQVSGQVRWSNGTFEPTHPHDVDHVNWLHVPSRDPHVLKGLMAVAVDQVGRVPHADRELTDDGSRISRGLHRKMGLRGHPRNPTMEPNVSLSPTLVETMTHSEVINMWEPTQIPSDTVARLTRSTFARPAWSRATKSDDPEQLRLL